MSALDGGRIVAVDIGSNAVRLLSSRIIVADGEHRLKKEMLVRMPVRLGDEVFTRGGLSDAVVERLSRTLLGFRHLIGALEPRAMRILATAALREAENGRAVVERLAAETGLRIDIIDGLEEATLLCANQLGTRGAVISADIGGGSADVALVSDGEIKRIESFALGTLRGYGGAELRRLRDWLRQARRSHSRCRLVGSGGNINKISGLVGRRDRVTGEALAALIGDLRRLTVGERIVRYNLRPDRADTILRAARLFHFILRTVGGGAIRAQRRGLADATAHRLLGRLLEEMTAG